MLQYAIFENLAPQAVSDQPPGTRKAVKHILLQTALPVTVIETNVS